VAAAPIFALENNNNNNNKKKKKNIQLKLQNINRLWNKCSSTFGTIVARREWSESLVAAAPILALKNEKKKKKKKKEEKKKKNIQLKLQNINRLWNKCSSTFGTIVARREWSESLVAAAPILALKKKKKKKKKKKEKKEKKEKEKKKKNLQLTLWNECTFGTIVARREWSESLVAAEPIFALKHNNKKKKKEKKEKKKKNLQLTLWNECTFGTIVARREWSESLVAAAPILALAQWCTTNGSRCSACR